MRHHTRASGLLLHPSSLPGPYGIGDVGPEARHFAEFLSRAGQRYWQVLPLGPTGYGDSPYQSFSSFAGNTLLISLDALVEDGLLSSDELRGGPAPEEERIDYGALIPWKTGILRKAWENAARSGRLQAEFHEFCVRNEAWLDDFALFMALKEAHGMAVWTAWPAPLALRAPEAIVQAREAHAQAIQAHKFLQFLFFRQWAALRSYAHERGISFIGDVPIYVAHDSADVWVNRALFHLDDAGAPIVVGGVPPDYFSKTGQLWGNPLYRWDRLAESGYRWWIERLRAVLSLVDVVRIDHFRGFEAYWEVPARDKTAEHGRWVSGPGEGLFRAFQEALGDPLPIIAENLGVITDEVEALRKRFNMPGMAVFQFGFGKDAATSGFPPHAYYRRLVAYTGTHDNDTLLGWWKHLSREKPVKDYIKEYLNTSGREFNWTAIRTLMASVADTVIFPVQDVLGLGSEGRMNRPGIPAGNWQWRMKPGVLSADHAARLRRMTEVYGRVAR